MAMDAQYFITKFEAIPEDRWTTGTYEDNQGRRCGIGHCRDKHGHTTDESIALDDLFNRVGLSVVFVNDGQGGYPQPTPKQRILAALRDAKERGL